jgi:hypothetical protein
MVWGLETPWEGDNSRRYPLCHGVEGITLLVRRFTKRVGAQKKRSEEDNTLTEVVGLETSTGRSCSGDERALLRVRQLLSDCVGVNR